MRSALTVLLIGMLAGFTVSAIPAARGAELTGRLLNGSVPDGVVAGGELRLTARLADESRLEREARSAADGSFRFTDLPGDTADVYVLSADHGALNYASGFIRFEFGETSVEADLIVYDATESPENIKLLGHHYIFETSPEAPTISVTEVLLLANVGNTAYRSSEPLRFPIPPLAQEPIALEGFQGAVREDDSMLVHQPFRPGHIEGVIRYLLPARFPLTFSSRQTLPVDELTVLVAPPGTQLTGEGLERMETVNLGGVICDRYQLPSGEVGDAFTIRIDSVRTTASLAPWLLVGGAAAVFAGLIFFRERRATSVASGVSAEAKRLLQQRNGYLEKVLTLEARCGDRTPDAGDFEKQKARLVAKAAAVQEMIDELEERGR